MSRRHSFGRTSNDATLGTLILAIMVCGGPFFLSLGINYFGYSLPLVQNVTGKLKQAADANNVPLARKKLGEVIEHLEDKGQTEGYTTVFIQRPANDLEYFYTNLKDAHADLMTFPDEPSESATAEEIQKYKLAESNQLMKLRETLLDDSGEGTTVTLPPHLAVFPNQVAWVVFGFWGTIIWAVIAGFGFAVKYDWN